jgi:integrase
MVKFLEKYKGKSKEYLLSGTEKPVEPRTMQYRFAKILKNVNLPSVHFHALRHMFASNCVKLGFDVKALSEILGHSNVEITLNRYVHSSFAQKVAYMERVKMDF